MKTIRRDIAVALWLGVLGLLPAAIFAADGPGTTAFDFLKMELGGRAAAMGGAMGAVADDADAMQHNPAALGSLTKDQATFMHNQYIEDLSQNYVGYANTSGWGVTLNHLDLGDFNRTTLSNPNGTNLGTFGGSDLALTVGYGRRMKPGLTAGACVKIIREELDGTAAQAQAIDLGVMTMTRKFRPVQWGFAIQNFGPNANFDSTRERLPMLARLSAASRFKALDRELLLALDAVKPMRDSLAFGIGVEYAVAPVFLLRGGYNSRSDVDSGLTFGAGFQWMERYRLDYAFVPFGEFGDAHRLSITARFGTAAPSAFPTVPRLEPVKKKSIYSTHMIRPYNPPPVKYEALKKK